MARKETIEIRAPRELDRFNDPIGPESDWVAVPGATVVPRNSSEQDQRGTVIIAGFMVVVPSVIAVSERHEIRLRGEVHQIDGDVGDYGRRKIFYTIRAK